MNESIERTLGRIEAGIEDLRRDIAERARRVDAIDQRVSWTEKKLNWLSGVAAAFGTSIAVAFKLHADGRG